MLIYTLKIALNNISCWRCTAPDRSSW